MSFQINLSGWCDDDDLEKDETTMILIFHLLLSEVNMHHSSIPNNIQFRVNYPFFWKEDFVNNFDTGRGHSTAGRGTGRWSEVR